MDEPPISIFVMRENKWRFENEWPIARTKYTDFYFAPTGGLIKDRAKEISAAARSKARSLSYEYIPWVGTAAGPQSPYLSFRYEDFQVQDDNRGDDALSLVFTSVKLNHPRLQGEGFRVEKALGKLLGHHHCNGLLVDLMSTETFCA
jgi:predicted acyl esterase